MLPILYLHGLSTGDFGPALRDLLGEDASGLSSSSIQRLTEQWQAEHAAFRTRELRFHRYAYLFVDGVNVSVRLGEDPRLCLLVVIGVREDGAKELLAVEDGYRESEDSWAAVFRDLRDRGLNEPKLVTGRDSPTPIALVESPWREMQRNIEYEPRWLAYDSNPVGDTCRAPCQVPSISRAELRRSIQPAFYGHSNGLPPTLSVSFCSSHFFLHSSGFVVVRV